jgi:GT2 family glycosyltransferase
MPNGFPSTDSLEMPQYLAPSAWVEHIPFAFDLIQILKPKILVELGVYQGVSYFTFCQAVRSHELQTVCYGIDNWRGDEHTSFYNEAIFEKVRDYNEQHYANFSHLLRGDFGDFLSQFSDGSIDLLHIDGYHTYEAVKNDFETWLPKLSASSIVLFHDTAVHDRGFGVHRLWAELCQSYPSLSFEHGYGLGVLATGKNIAPGLQPLFQSPPSDLSALKNLYHRLGVPFQDQLDLQSAKKELETEKQVTAELQKRSEEFSHKEDRLTQLEDQLGRLRSELHQMNRANADLKKESENKSARLLSLEAEKKRTEDQLRDIYSSDGYRLLSVYYRLKERVIPEGSRRHARLKSAFNFLRGRSETNPPLPAGLAGGRILKKGYTEVPGVPENIQFPVSFPKEEQPLVSIVIPAYNNWVFTRNCLISIYQHTWHVPYEIIVGDNLSTDETRHIEEYFQNIRYIRNKENLGYIRNVNNAAGQARGEYILTLNNDTIVTPYWLSTMVELMKRYPKAGLIGSKLVYPAGALQEAGGIIWRDASAWNFGNGADPESPEFNYVKEVDYISGASNLIRRELWQKLHGLDERYVPAYFDDSDLAMGIRSLGYKVMYQPLSMVYHYEGLTHGTNTSSGTKKYQELNHAKFIDKWKNVLEKQHFPNGENVFHARDKSDGKKTILVIDHYVPQFDKDAGSRTVFQYLDLFVDLGLNVKFIGDNFHRHEPYATILQQKGIEVLYGEYYAANHMKWLEENEQYIDFIFLNRPHISIKYIDLVRKKMRGKVFYYMHDLHFLRELMEYEITREPQKLEDSRKWKEIEYSLFDKSDVVLTPSIREKELLSGDLHGKPIEVMPAFFYPSIADPIRNFDQRKDILFIGGFNHTPNIDAVKWFAREVFPLVRQKDPTIRFVVVGSQAPEEIIALDSEQILVRGFLSDEELDEVYSSVRLAVIPLRYGAGVKGKTVEAMSRALPLVSTSFGLEGLKDIGNLLAPCDTAGEFAGAVLELYASIPRLTSQSRFIQEYASTHFTKSAAAIFFKGLFGL